MSEQNPYPASARPDLGGHVPNRRGALSRARSRSLLNTVLMIIMPLIFIGTTGYFLYEAGLFEDFGSRNASVPKSSAPTSSPTITSSVKPAANAPKRAVKPFKPEALTKTGERALSKPKRREAALDAIVSDKIKMVAPKITRFDKKSRTYIVQADTAERDPKQPDIVLLKKVKAEIRLPRNSQKVFVTANNGRYNKTSEELVLTGQILVTSTNGYRATLSKARVWLKDGRISSRQPVIVYMPQGSVAANGVEMLDGGATIRFLNRARMDINGSGS